MGETACKKLLGGFFFRGGGILHGGEPGFPLLFKKRTEIKKKYFLLKVRSIIPCTKGPPKYVLFTVKFYFVPQFLKSDF